MSVTLMHGDCLEILPTLPANSIDSIVCDPPYGLSFMGKHWDHGVPGVAFWEAALRVAKPGAMLLAFGGTRTFHRLTVAIEDAGWEIRDCLMWLYGSGFPKSHDISKAIDKHLGAEREVIGVNPYFCEGRTADPGEFRQGGKNGSQHITAPATPAAKQWDGWGTALKPSFEPIILAMKPLDGTFAQNAIKWGVAGLNIDASRITITDGATMARNNKPGDNGWKNSSGGPNSAALNGEPNGRWPANLLLDEEAAALLDEMSGELHTHSPGKAVQKGRIDKKSKQGNAYGAFESHVFKADHASTGGASRFFYCAKASKRDRDEGLEGMEEREAMRYSEGGQGPLPQQTPRKPALQRNHHPCVKPTALCRYLVRLVTPKGGTVLDPFMGSGSTLKAAVLEGFNGVGIELDSEYLEIARRRIAHAAAAQAETHPQLPLLETA